MTDPFLIAWSDQFSALLREKVFQMMKALEASGWENMTTEFPDPYDDDSYRLIFDGSGFYLMNLALDNGVLVEIDINRLGIA